MFAPVPFTLFFDLDPGAVDQEMQEAVRAPIRNIDCQGFLPAAQRAEIWNRPVQSSQAQKAFYKTRCLSQGKTKQNF